MHEISFDHVIGHQYTVFDGLAGMHVEDLYQDREGFLWIATADGGVSRFDSAHFDNFGLKDGLPNQRREDIPAMAAHFVARYAQDLNHENEWGRGVQREDMLGGCALRKCRVRSLVLRCLLRCKR